MILLMDNYQHTIKNCISLSGIGLHTGHKSTITFKPSKEDSGILFKRIEPSLLRKEK